ncbi:MAG: family 10 glycosylhydrolase [Clostridia bacterium]|nr:family 10 glycosylhydrolase [Clostridia bacterium]
MRRYVAILMSCVALVACAVPQSFAMDATQSGSNIQVIQDTQNIQAAWMATVFGIDFPKTQNDPEAQKKEFTEKMDKLQALGINTIVVQVRPTGDALYQSIYNPWSSVLTGTQGKYPGYDPLAYMVEAAHRRGMALHAWLNPYRVTTKGTDISALSENHPARLNPDLVISYNEALYYNPEKESVKNLITNTVCEIISKYDVDGIVFDDYFYPSNYPLPEGESRDGAVANARRAHVNDLIKRVHTTIETTRPDVLFGISPMGIWKNASSDPTGSATAGNEAYYSVCSDARTWIKNEWIDYISPQIYWSIGTAAADYETLVKWWSNEVAGTSVKLWISQGIYRESVASQIDQQLAINRKYAEVTGSMYYNVSYLLSDIGACQSKIAEFNGVPKSVTVTAPQ